MPYQNLSFGTGACYCAGAALARLQAAVVIPSLLNGFPGWGCPWKPAERFSGLGLSVEAAGAPRHDGFILEDPRERLVMW
ncbi:hypothetical protein [Saccharopolyspora spinosa]|uniref:hypothetical protein n=1 Tax=Saccharopolyspora spinosa TaxID=60894 RepID=UPI0011D17D60|nr:hypothetical protein [Saccharopolyspora spinosa]